jgi:fructose-1-phosphate kinase PfkB-like protein
MKIATLTLNPAVDRTMYCGEVRTGALNRAAAPSVTTHGGKGTNVSCVFKLLGTESTAYGFIGGDMGELFLKLLTPYDINTDFTKTKCNSRMNIKIIAENGEPTEFNEAGGVIEPDEKEDLLEKIKNCVGANCVRPPKPHNLCGRTQFVPTETAPADLFFMGGSVPPGVEKSIYRDIINIGDKTKFILDCDGDALKLCMAKENAKKPYMIKPNQFELEQYLGKKFDLEKHPPSADGTLFTKEGRAGYEARKIFDETGVIVLCTLGEHGGLYCGPEGVYYQAAPKVEVRGFTGAGDTFLTAFCAVYFGLFDLDNCRGGNLPPAEKYKNTPAGKYRNTPAEKDQIHGRQIAAPTAKSALAFAVAASAAKVTKPGTEFAPVSEMIEMYERI